MSKQIIAKILVVFLFCFVQLSAQDETSFSLVSKESKPSIGLGIGVLNFYGDVNSLGNSSALLNQFGYEVHVARKINNYSDLGFSFLTGTILGNERSPDRNLNFKTNVYSISVYATYNLDYWLYFSKVFNPFFTVGFESFEYNNKADLVDANGNPYYYWNDGTIRDIDQFSSNASQASLMQRDYVYETDLRSANLDGFGKYPQLAIGVPVGLGFNLNVSDRLAFKFSSVFHYTFTDLIDNLSKNGEGIRKGNSMNDFFTFNSFSVHYDLLNAPPNDNPEDFVFPDYFALDMADSDQDGVVDGIDICPFTPEGVEVDEFGCAIDSDQDGVPDYKDKELSEEGVFVGADGITLTDEDFYHWYLRYIDSAAIPIEVLFKMAGSPQKSVEYRILLGEYRGPLPTDLAKKFVDEGDVFAILNQKSQTAYLTKKYNDLKDAEQRRDALLDKNLPQADIVVWEGKRYYTLQEWKAKEEKELRERYKEHFENKEQLEDMFAIKLGDEVPSANRADKSKYFEYEDVVALKGDSNKTDFVIGPFINDVSAKQLLKDVDSKKFPNAEVVKVDKGTAKPVGVTIKDVPKNNNPKGAEEWNKNRKEKPVNPQKVLESRNGNYVIEFEAPNSPEKELLIKSQEEVVKVKTKSGEEKLITKAPQSKEYAHLKVEEYKQKGIVAKVTKVQDGDLIPVKETPKEKAKRLISNLGNGFSIQLEKNDSKTLKTLEDVVDPSEIEKITTADGEEKVIIKPTTKESVVETIAVLEKEGVQAKVVEVANGEILPSNRELPKPSDENVLKSLNNQLIVDFGNVKDPEKIKTIQKTVETVEVKTKDGEVKLVSKKPLSVKDAIQVVEKLSSENIPAEIAKVKNNEVKVVRGNTAEIKAQNNILTDLNESFVIDFGEGDQQKESSIKSKTNSGLPIKTVIDNSGKSIILSDQPKSKEEAIAIVKELKSKSIEATVAKVKDGKLESVVFDTDNSANEVTAVDASPKSSTEKVKTIEPSIEDGQNFESPAILKGKDEKYLVKVGTITESTSKEEAKKLLNAPNSVKIKNSDQSIDVISKNEFNKEEEAHKDKAVFQSKGFDGAKVAYVKDGKLKVLQKEELDGKYSISLGSFKSNVSNDDVNRISSIPDVESMETFNPDVTTYTVGKFDDPEDAEKRIEELTEQGFKPTLVKYEDGKIKNVDFNTVFDIETVKRLKLLSEESDVLKTDEIVFRVQLGAYRNKIPESVFKGVKTLSFPSSGGITKYVTGSFNTYQQAYIHKITMRKLGFEGAFTVAYKDGKQIKVTDLVNNEKYKQVKETVSPVEQKLEKVISEPKTESVKSTPTISYRVQLGAYKGNEMDEKVSEFPNVEMEVYGQYKRYLVGNFNSYTAASNYKKEVKNKGFNGAFVVAYNNGQRVAVPGDNPNVITTSDLNDAKNETSASTQYDKNKVMILIQVGLYRGDIPPDLKEKYRELPNLTKQVTAHGVIRYMTGNFKNLAEAAAYKEELVKKGFEGAFLVAYYDNERIKIQKAIDILKQ